MSKTNQSNSFLKNMVTFLIVFLAIQFIFNLFAGPQQKDDLLKQGEIGFITDKTEFGLREAVSATIQNNSSNDITIENRCPNEPLAVNQLENGSWNPKTYSANLNCEETDNITLKPGEKTQIIFTHWTNNIFNELGFYKLSTTINGNTIESNQFEIKPQGAFGWFWTTFFYQPIYNILIGLISILPGRDLGLAIILLTIIIRTILLIPSQKALKAQKRLQEIQPKIDALKDKHGADQQKMAQEMMQLYKDHKVSPFSSCLPLLIQFPVLIALFYVVQNGLNPDNDYLLYPFINNFDLTTINTNFLGILELTQINLIVLPLIVGLLQYLQMKLSVARASKNATKTPSEMQMANNIMVYMMPVMIAIFTASVPAGVGLYWCFSTIYGIIQQLVVNYESEKNLTQIKESSISRNKDKKRAYKEKHSKKQPTVIEGEITSTPANATDTDEDSSNKITKIKI